MEFSDVVRRRRMVRNFTREPVERAVVDRILEAATHAPSAGFSQGWAFLVLDEPDDVERFWAIEWPETERSGPHTGVMRAPVLVLPLASKRIYLERYAEADKGWTDRDETRWPTPFWIVDTAFASMLALLGVVDAGLGALFFGVRRAEEVRAAFGVPDDHEPIGAIALGHRADDTPSPSLARGRRGLDQVVHRGRWRG